MAPRVPSAWEKSSPSSSSYFDPSGPFSDFKVPSFSDYSSVFKQDKDEAFSRAWKTGFDADDGGKEISSLYSSLFDKAKKTDKYRQWGEDQRSGQFGSSQGAFGGDWSRGGGGQVLENLGVVYPQQHSPMFIPGVEGKKGIGGTIGSIVGGIGGALIGGPVGAAIGAAGGPIGSLFG